jgi:hypothetical protein
VTMSTLVVERVDSLPSRPSRVLVTGPLDGEPLSVGDDVAVYDGERLVAETTIRSIEIHSAPGRTTLALEAPVEIGYLVVRASR